MKAGGWADRKTMETCYQHADDAGVLAVMESTTKLRERKPEVQPEKLRRSCGEAGENEKVPHAYTHAGQRTGAGGFEPPTS